MVQVSAKDAIEAEKIARELPDQCEELSSSVEEMTGSRQVWSVYEVVPSKKVFMIKGANMNSQDILIHDGETESCMRTGYPMHVEIVKRLLREAGYVEVSLWPPQG